MCSSDLGLPGGDAAQQQQPYNAGGYDFQPGTDVPADSGTPDAPPVETPAAPADPFAALPDDHPLRQQLRTAEEQARAAKEMAESLKSKTDAWDAEIQKAQQQQEVQQLTQALEAWQEKFDNGTLSPQEVAQTRALVERGVAASKLVPMGNGVFVTSQDTIKQHQAFDAWAAQTDLANHAYTALMDAFPPNASLATLRAKHKELMALAPSGIQTADQRVAMLKGWMAQQAKVMAGTQYAANQRDNAPRERVEGGGQGIGGGSDWDRYQKALRSGGPMPFTPEQIDRIMADRYRAG